jgi:hypothetical protein
MSQTLKDTQILSKIGLIELTNEFIWEGDIFAIPKLSLTT